MTQWQNGAPVPDEVLVAWLDNQLTVQQHRQVEKMLSDDPELAERLAELDRASVDFSAAFAPLLQEAPKARLQQRLSASLEEPQKPRAAGISRRTLIAATVSALALGVVGGMKGKRLFDNDDGWRDTVAQYMALYTHQTFEEVSPSDSAMQQQLASVSSHLGLSLSASALTLPGSAFKGARMLNYDDKAIAQIVWDDPNSGPLALCITGAVHPTDRGFAEEQRRGMNVVYWQQQQHSFMLIGHKPVAELRKVASSLSAAV
jgi:anti-sigma factor RsiW